MVANVTSLTGKGLRDWIIQRVSAVVVAAYVLFLLYYCLTTPGLDYIDWQVLFHTEWMRIFTLMFLLMLSWHAWIGVWTIATDYVKNTPIRLLGLFIVLITLLGCFIWGVQIIWGV